MLLHFFWKKGLTATAVTRKICEVGGKGMVSERTARRWFEHFNHGDASVVDKPSPGRLSIVNDEALRAAVKWIHFIATVNYQLLLTPLKTS